MNTTEKIIDTRKKLNKINNTLIEYANWIENLELKDLEIIYGEFEESMEQIKAQIKLSSSVAFLLELKNKVSSLVASFTKDINSLKSTVKIAEINKFTKQLNIDLENIKTLAKSEYDNAKLEIAALNKELNDKINLDNSLGIGLDASEELNAIDDKINILINSNSKQLLDMFQQDNVEMMIKVNNYNITIENFNGDIISSVTAYKKLDKLLEEATPLINKHNLSPLEYSKLSVLKKEYYQTLKKYNNYIDMQAIAIINDISNFINIDYVLFISKWNDVIEENYKYLLNSDKNSIRKNLKQTSDAVSKLNKTFKAFVKNTCDDYALNITNNVFTAKNE